MKHGRRDMISGVMMALAAGISLAASAMETLSLDGLWEFAFEEGRKLDEVSAVFEATDKMPVPCCFDLTPNYYMKRGAAQYRRMFTLDREFAGGFLVVKGMGLRSRFWLDGREIGMSKLVFSELTFPVGPLAAGEHTLVAAVDNRVFGSNSELFQPYYDFLASGGFYHGVELKLQSLPVELERVLVRNRDYRTGKVEMELCFKKAADGLAVVDEGIDAWVAFDGATPAKVRFAGCRATFSVPDFQLWSPASPHLHRVRVTVEGRGSAEARFGIRSFTCGEGRFWLNGEPIFLKGVNRHDADSANGYATTRQSMWRDLTLIKRLGANFVRTSHYPPSDEFLSLCDEMGLLVWQESIGWQNSSGQMADAAFIALQVEQARLMARHSINHPSAVIDAFLNEFNSQTEAGKALAERLIDVLHAEDTGRPVTYATCRLDEIANDKTDFIAFNLYPAWHQDVGRATTRESMRQTIRGRLHDAARLFRERHGADKPIMIAETGCYSLFGNHDPEGAQWSEEFQAEYLGNSVGFAVEDPDIQGVAVWQFCDSRTYFRGGADIRTRPLGMNMAGLYDIHCREKRAASVV
ncbi:MAG: hypothetical protein J6334_00575, partial [Kiritimatiellae bacterium]|nr:hypothetical protein [Kiritimatiellia bacterium]